MFGIFENLKKVIVKLSCNCIIQTVSLNPVVLSRDKVPPSRRRLSWLRPRGNQQTGRV